uniref:Exonuclease domain-containing protein n=1 Tax=Ananas comosus var. bracteatus TaxID=296719 RepID=A0A6V7Q7V0_ANACO|nr:unnamed protein product [Ananas comosus var. bracteatus]
MFCRYSTSVSSPIPSCMHCVNISALYSIDLLLLQLGLLERTGSINRVWSGWVVQRTACAPARPFLLRVSSLRLLRCTLVAMSLARISSPSLFSHLSSSSSSHLLLPHALIPIASLPPRLFNRSLLPISASFSSQTCDPSMETEAPNPTNGSPCVCTTHRGSVQRRSGSNLLLSRTICRSSGVLVESAWNMDDAMHLEKFNHDILVDLRINSSSLDKLRPQNLDYLLVLDLEGKVEILEFPVVMIDSKSMEFVDSFHRFVRPSKMSEQRIMEYIEGKYGKFGVDRVWHDTALPFIDVLQEFEEWITTHHLWNKEQEGSLNRAAFVTCGNWDVKTKIPEQCRVSKIKLPSYFKEWINLKDIYLNFYNRRATGMMTMMRQLQMLPRGSHHLGIDDCKNIARVLQRMLADGVLMQITARRNSSTPADVKFLFKNRIR